MIPSKLKSHLDSDYGTDGWTCTGRKGDIIFIKFYLINDTITFDAKNWA